MKVEFGRHVLVTIIVVCGSGLVHSVPNQDSIIANRTIAHGTEDGGNAKVLSRQKRYVAFPEGSSFSV